MRQSLFRLAETLLALGRALREPRVYIALLAAIGIWSLAYQQKAAYKVDVGGPGDDAYVSGFNAKEHNEALDYRWSGPSSVVRFPGIGNEPVYLTLRTIGFRPSGSPPVINVRARGQDFTLQTHSEPYDETFFLPRNGGWEGSLKVEIASPTFSPQGDPRHLGVIVDRVTVSPATSGLRPVVIPPLPEVVAGALSILLLYLTVAGTLRSRAVALSVVYGLSVVFGALILAARPELGLLAEIAPGVALWTLALGLAGRFLLDLLHVPGQAAGWGGLAFAAAVGLRFGGTIYPQFLTSDIMLHVHNLQSVLRGQWLFTEPLPDGTVVPYPNALYVLLSPVAALMGQSDASLSWLMKWSGSLLDSLTCLALAWSVPRLWGIRAAAFAALAYAVSPAVYELLSAGNYTNLFAQSLLNLTLLGALVYLRGRSTALNGFWGAALLAVGFALTMLGHYGVMLAALALVGFFALLSVVSSQRGGAGAGRAWAVVGTAGLGLAFSVALYYRHFGGEMWAQWSGLYQRLTGAKLGRKGTDAASGGLADFVVRRSVLVSPLLALTAASGGLLGLAVQRRGSAQPPAVGSLIGAWIAASVLFGALDRVLGDTVRWAYLGAAAIALLAGRFLACLWLRGRAALLLTGFALAAVLWYTLLYWVGDLIFTRYH